MDGEAMIGDDLDFLANVREARERNEELVCAHCGKAMGPESRAEAHATWCPYRKFLARKALFANDRD